MRVYQILIHIYGMLIYISSLFSRKAKLWIIGRKNIFDTLPNGKKEDIFWIHCASLGEYEQARPLIKSFKSDFRSHKIFLTFFSLSGYMNVKKNENIDYISYLPLDTTSNARQFVNKVNPQLAIFIKSELWPNVFNMLNKHTIPIFVVSAIFNSQQYFFKPYGKWHLSILKKVKHFFVQDENSKKILNSFGIDRLSVCGDNRYDKVIENSKHKVELPLVKSFKNKKPLVVCGSTYKSDTKMLISISKRMPNVKFIIVPHDPILAHKFKDSGILYSQANEENIEDYSMLIIDNIGLLSQLYYYANVSYVGGAFGKGLHNILEAIAFGSPVIFGPNYRKYNEAVEAIEANIAKSANSESELEDSICYFLQAELSKNDVFSFCESKKGANNTILKTIKSCF